MDQSSKSGTWGKRIATVAAWSCSIVGVLVSIYMIWGWITTADIKRYCKEHKVDYDDVAERFLTSRIDGLESTIAENSTNQSLKVSFRQRSPIERLGISFSIMSSEAWKLSTATNGNITFSTVDGYVIEPFMAFSDNFLSALYSFGLGYLLSFVILLGKVLRRDELPLKYVTLRSLLGGCCAACLFLLVLSCGTLLLENSGEVRSSALGVIGVMGALVCEKFERVLKKGFPDKLESITGTDLIGHGPVDK